MELDDRITISTPEGVDLDLVLAGLGSRFVAGLVDLTIQALIIVGLMIVFFSGDPQGLDVGLFVVGAFLVMFGYDIVFETWNAGRSPGKMAVGLRVVRTQGQPETFLPACVRNLLRVVDGFCLLTLVLAPVGVVAIIVSTRNQRLGDLAAETVVIRERRTRRPAAVTPSSFSSNEPLLQWDVSAVTPDEVATIRRFLERRATLQPEPRARLAWDLATRLQPKIAGAPSTNNAEAFLEGILAAKAARA